MLLLSSLAGQGSVLLWLLLEFLQVALAHADHLAHRSPGLRHRPGRALRAEVPQHRLQSLAHGQDFFQTLDRGLPGLPGPLLLVATHRAVVGDIRQQDQGFRVRAARLPRPWVVLDRQHTHQLPAAPCPQVNLEAVPSASAFQSRSSVQNGRGAGR